MKGVGAQDSVVQNRRGSYKVPLVMPISRLNQRHIRGPTERRVETSRCLLTARTLAQPSIDSETIHEFVQKHCMADPKRLLRLRYSSRQLFFNIHSPCRVTSTSCTYLLEDTLEIDTLRPLDGQTQCPIPDKLCQRTKATANTEGSCIV